MQSDAIRPQPADRGLLRSNLLAARDQFVASPDFARADRALTGHLLEVLRQLQPECLGLYWPIRSEFNAVAACRADAALTAIGWALPCCRRSPHQMEFRRWNGRAPNTVDDCGIACTDGQAVVPDVVLVPCLGFTRGGFRLGYGAGFFDRWQAAHPHVTAIGVAWAAGLLQPEDFVAEPHDQPLLLVVTEQGVIGG